VSKHGAGLLQRTFKYASGRLTNSSAWQEVAPYSSRRHSQDCLPDRQVKIAAGTPANGISQGSTCICLPARSPALRDEGRSIFDQPGKSEFFNRIFGFDPFGAVRLRLKEGAKKCRSGATLIKFRSSGQEIVGLTLGGASLIKFKS